MIINKTFSSELDFWRQFVNIFNAFAAKGKKLTDKEIDILAVCLTFSLETRYPFKGIKRKQIKETLGIAEQTLAMHKKNIEEKGWLVDGSLSKQLRTMYEFIKKQDEVHSSITIKMDIDESLRNTKTVSKGV